MRQSSFPSNPALYLSFIIIMHFVRKCCSTCSFSAVDAYINLFLLLCISKNVFIFLPITFWLQQGFMCTKCSTDVANLRLQRVGRTDLTRIRFSLPKVPTDWAEKRHFSPARTSVCCLFSDIWQLPIYTFRQHETQPKYWCGNEK